MRVLVLRTTGMPHHGRAWAFSRAGQTFLVVDTQRMTDAEIRLLVETLEAEDGSWPDLEKLQARLNGRAHTG